MKNKVREDNARGVVICPRVIAPSHTVANLPALIDSSIRLKSTKGQISAAINAKMTTGFGQGLAEAEILTTNQVQPGKLIRDTSTNLFPYVQIKYVPNVADQNVNSEFIDKMVMGLQARVVLQNSLNHWGEVKVQLGIGIKEFQLEEAQPIKIRKKQFIVDKGTCYALVYAVVPQLTFKKELLAHTSDTKHELEDMVEAYGK